MFTVAALHQWAHDEPPALDTKCVVTAEAWINEVMRPVSVGGPLPCVSSLPLSLSSSAHGRKINDGLELRSQFLQSSTPEDVKPVYGKSYPRLLALKTKMDPEGFFCHSMFPRPHAPDEWGQLPPLTQARMRRAHAETERLRGKGKAGGSGGGRGGPGEGDGEGGEGEGRQGEEAGSEEDKMEVELKGTEVVAEAS
jgi:hypothetical protein